ncbi:chalcone isomerase family protein [Stigmatella sp. ncwal1]|uniref:Chalcone isomerase family protein n=1 Tax=Stigmatella ashevillensis TaxID=2995309 RepID=A0ABT5D7N3_9BACT|nr:chalcone isomerase family protein [Stigmatella ashevillena]MDC0709085.1 chalcone isomerase family protein [Stigmatella ashevillena]
MKAMLPALVLSLSLALPAVAQEKTVAGVKFPATLAVEGKELKLNGAGLRTKAIFKVYTVGLYLETPSQDAAQIISSDQIKRVRMTMLRDLEKAKITDAISDGIAKNNKAQMPALQQRLDTFKSAIPDLKKGDELVLTYVPGKGTRVESKTGQEISVEGKDFADALFGVWLGKSPVDGGLKDGMLGKDD